ncbi:MAG: hypothetical protein ACRCZ2_01130 [Fusobacteriaceae bacterium]
MKKITLILILTSLIGCSTIDMKKQHRAEKKVLRADYREQIKPLEEQFNKDLKKLKGKQTIQFGVLIADKFKSLANFFR